MKKMARLEKYISNSKKFAHCIFEFRLANQKQKMYTVN